MNTLLCLLSEQRMQNVIPLLQRGLKFDRVVLLASQEDQRISSRFARIATDLSGSLRSLAAWELHPLPVDPMLAESARQACLEIIRRSGGPGQVTVNFTGGTKPMSIGAYQAGLECGTQLLYVDTQAEQIYCYTKGIPQSVPFDLSPIGVQMLLAAHGRIVDRKAMDRLALTPVELQLTELIYDHRPESLPALVSLRQQMKPAAKGKSAPRCTSPEAWAVFPQLLVKFEEVGFAYRSDEGICLTPVAYRFIDGNWLEGYVYWAMEKSGLFVDVVSRVKLSGVENELDVVCTLNAKLGVVECKVGSLVGPAGQSTLNRLRALRDSLGGTFAKSFLITPHPAAGFSDKFVKRAREYVSCMVHQEELHRVEEIVANEMHRKRR